MGMSKNEVMEKLKSMSDVDTESLQIRNTERPFLEEYINWKFNSMEAYGNVIFQNNQVISMFFPLFKKIPLSKFIGMHGQPDKIIVRKERLDSTFIPIFLLYIDKGVCLHHTSNAIFMNPKSFIVLPSLTISRVYYADTSMPDWLFKIGCGGLDEKIDSQLIQEWKGYGRYPIIEPEIPRMP